MKKIITLILALALISCSSDDDNNNDDNTPAFEPIHVEFTTIGQGFLSGNGNENISESNLVINNDNDWNNLLNQMDSNGSVTDVFSTTDIDFSVNTIIAVFLEVKPFAWKVVITEIIEYEDSVVVSIIDIPQILSIVSQPFYIVEVPKTDKPIIFE